MLFNDLHPVLKEQLLNCDYTQDALADKQLCNFITMVNQTYIDAAKLGSLDIAEMKQLEHQNEQKQMMLSHAGRLAALGEMATGIAHELNQPLSIIKTNMQGLDFLSATVINLQELKEITQSTIRQVDRASKIINHMRNFARKNQDNKIEKINILEPIENALSMFNEQFRLHEIKITKNFRLPLPTIAIQAHELEQIVVNLLSNSRYAVESRQRKNEPGFEMVIILNLSYSKDIKCIIFEIEDNGIGMDEKSKNHCFEPFYTTKEVGAGTGLGLSIVYNIVKSISGKIEVESELDKGTLIRIFFQVGEESWKR